MKQEKTPYDNKFRRAGLKQSIVFAIIIFAVMTVSYVIVIYIRSFLFRHGISETHKAYVSIRNITVAVESIFVGSVVSLIAARYLLRPLDEAISVLNAVSKRDFTVKMHKYRHGRILKRLSRTLNNTVDELASVELLRMDFINNFSHEFKTPIVSIEGFAKLIKDGNLTEEEKNEFLDIIISESERLTKMSSNMLLLSFVEKSEHIGPLTKCNVSEQIRKTIASMYVKGSAVNAEISFDGGEIYAECSPELMGHVWTNLIDNAVKYSADNPVIAVSAKESEGYAVISISDNGKGIGADELSRIFDKFYRTPGAEKNGNGIGLAIVQKIIKLHNGEISVESAEGTGSTFTVRIPLVHTEKENEE